MLDAILRLFGFHQEGGAKPPTPRSPKWPAARRAHLLREPECAVCGAKGGNDVHHVLPYHLYPAHELEPANMMTLCRPHHLLFGHFMAWVSWDKDVRADAALWRAKIAGRP